MLKQTPGLFTFCCCLLSLATTTQAGDCREIEILNKAEADPVVYEDYEGSAVDPRFHQRQVVRSAEKLMPPLLCSAARRVAFVKQDLRANRGLAGRTDKSRPDLLQMSAGPGPGLASEEQLAPQAGQPRAEDKAAIAQALTLQAILHEAAHAADYLLQWFGKDEPGLIDSLLIDVSRWTEETRALARETVKRNRLAKGLREEWSRIHNGFGRAGWATNYHGQGQGAQMSDEDIVKGGFMSVYGGSNPADDIAEMTGWALAGRATRYAALDPSDGTSPQGPVRDLACVKLQSLPGPGVPIEYAGIYTKLGFLQSLGFIDEESYRHCVGNVKVRGEGQGFFTFVDGNLSRGYTGQLDYRIGKRTRDGQVEERSPYIFEATATGTIKVSGDGEVPARVTLRLAVADPEADLEDASFPRGLYPVGLAEPNNQLIIIRTDNDKVVVEVTQGLALVARASEDLIEGTVVVQKYFNYSGGMLSAIGGPEPPPKPTLMTFRIGG